MPNLPAQQLAASLTRARDAILRRWARELRATAHPLSRAEFDARLAPLVDELVRVLRDAEDPPRTFAALVADLGRDRFLEGTSLRSSARELTALHLALLAVEPPTQSSAMLLAAIIGEALVAVAHEHARAARVELVRFRETGLLAELQRHLDVGVIVVQRDGVVTFASDAVERIFGVPVKQLAGQSLLRAGATLLGPASARSLDGRPLGFRRLPLWRAFDRGCATPALTFRVRNARSGQQLVCEASAFTVEEAGRPGGVLALFRDVTAAVHQAEDLARADRELTAQHARLLRRGHQQAIGDLAAATSLALNNELNAVALSLPLLRVELADGKLRAPGLQRHLDAMEAAVARAAARVGELQALAAPRGRGPIRSLDLNDAVMAALDLVRPELTAAATDRTVRVDARLGSVPPVYAEAAELRELLCALLVDARDRLPTGSVLEVWTQREDHQATLALSHYGVDAAADEERHLALGGWQDAARRWGGELVFDASGGHTTVRLTLPIASATAPAVAPPAPVRVAAAVPEPTGPIGGARHILILDDDAGSRETLSELLLLTGHSVDAFSSGAEALIAADERQYDAALVDLALPDMNGWEIARRLRAHHPRLRIAIVTGWEPAATAGRAPPGVVDALFRKPIDLPAIQSFLAAERAADAAPSPTPRH